MLAFAPLCGDAEHLENLALAAGDSGLDRVGADE
jgi:hypothetical protein